MTDEAGLPRGLSAGGIKERLALLAIVVPVPFVFAVAANRGLVIVALAASAFAWWRFRSARRLLLPNLVLNLLGLGCLFAVWFFRRAVAPSLTAFAIHLLLFLLVVRVMSLRGRREEWTTLLLLAFLVVGAAATAVDPSILAYLAFVLFFVVETVCRLVYLQSRETAIRAVAEEEVFPPRRFLRRTLLTAVVFAVPVFLVLPRVRSPFLPGLSTGTEVGSGFADTIDLNSINDLKRSSAVVLRARLEPWLPDPEGMRFRGQTYTRYEGGRWRRGLGHSPLYAPSNGKIELRSGDPDETVTVGLVRTGSSVLFVPYGAVDIELDTWLPFVERDRSGVVSVRYPPTRPITYVVRTTAEPDRSESCCGRYDLELPAQGLDRLRDLAERVAGADGDDDDVARRIEAYLSTTYAYSLEPASVVSGEDPVESFLFERQRGHCEMFATAMTLMLRSRGVPARFVVGFMGGETPFLTREIVVRDMNAHAWVEAWSAREKQWRVFDPTPASGRPRVEKATFLSEISQIWDRGMFLWDRYVLGYDVRDQLGLLGALRRSGRSVVDSVSAPLKRLEGLLGDLRSVWSRRREVENLAMLAIGATLVALLVAGWLGRRRRRRKRSPGRDALESALAILARSGRLEAEAGRLTVREIGERLTGTPPAAAFAVVAGLYEVEAFGGDELDADARAKIRAAVAELRAAVPTRRRSRRE